MINSPVIEIEKVCFRYDGEPVLDEISLTVHEGEFLGIVGPNGGGKTTLLKILLGFLKPVSGQVRIFGQPPQEAAQQIGYVSQHVQFDPTFPISVQEVVLMGLLRNRPLAARYGIREKEKADQALREVDMLKYRNRLFGQLSGGQRQRVLIARALAGDPRLLVMDEPTSHVDSWSQNQIFDLLRRINEHCTLVVVSHDLSIVSAYVTRVACLNHRLLIHPTKELSHTMLESMYRAPVHWVDHQQNLE